MSRGTGACSTAQTPTRTRTHHTVTPRAHRLTDFPVVAAESVPGYGAIFNAGVIMEDGVFSMLARGVRDSYRENPDKSAGQPRFLDYVSDILLLTSNDGVNYDYQRPLVSGGTSEIYAYEDARAQRVISEGKERLLMTYTHLPYFESGEPWRIGVQELAYVDGELTVAPGSEAKLIGPPGYPDKDGVIFNLADGRVALIHRIRPVMQIAIFDTLEELLNADDAYWADHMAHLEEHTLIAPEPGADCVGAGAPPIPTADGLLCFYHQREGDGQYSMRLALLDNMTGLVKATLPEPLLNAEYLWERTGDVNEVIFVEGAVMQDDGTIYLTYGAADRHVGAATVNAAELLTALREVERNALLQAA
jgi:predicted GH43/DUF377 family glycosyl hydrolase